MKYLLVTILILTSFIGMSQKGIGGTGWKFEHDCSLQEIILLDSDLTFKNLVLVSDGDLLDDGQIYGMTMKHCYVQLTIKSYYYSTMGIWFILEK